MAHGNFLTGVALAVQQARNSHMGVWGHQGPSWLWTEGPGTARTQQPSQLLAHGRC